LPNGRGFAIQVPKRKCLRPNLLSKHTMGAEKTASYKPAKLKKKKIK